LGQIQRNTWARKKRKTKKKEKKLCGTAPVMLPRSIITSDAVATTGIWQAEEDGSSGENIRFEISNDLSRALVTLHVPGKVTGKLTLTSHSLRCLPVTEAEPKGSVFWWLRPIAMVSVDADRRVDREGDGRV
jgi:hypothetical protein